MADRFAQSLTRSRALSSAVDARSSLNFFRRSINLSLFPSLFLFLTAVILSFPLTGRATFENACQTAFAVHTFVPLSSAQVAIEAPPTAGWSSGRLISLPSAHPTQTKQSAPSASAPKILSIVVPVYRELHNQNIQRLLAALEGQIRDLFLLQKLQELRPHELAKRPEARLDLQAVQIIALVNNAKEIAAQTDHPIRAENQATLKLLKEFQTRMDRYNRDESPFPSEPTLAKGPESKPQIHLVPVDLSSRGYETNMGRIRRLGDQIAINRAKAKFPKVTAKQHVVITLDADIRPDKEFLLHTFLMFATTPDADAQVASVTYEPDSNIGPTGLRLFHHRYSEYLVGHIRDLIRGDLVSVGSPQYAVRASALTPGEKASPSIRFSAQNKSGEDTYRGLRLNSSPRIWIRNGMARITAQGRLREDGFEAADFKRWIESGEATASGRPLDTLTAGFFNVFGWDFTDRQAALVRARKLDPYIALRKIHGRLDKLMWLIFKKPLDPFPTKKIRTLIAKHKDPSDAFNAGYEHLADYWDQFVIADLGVVVFKTIVEMLIRPDAVGLRDSRSGPDRYINEARILDDVLIQTIQAANGEKAFLRGILKAIEPFALQKDRHGILKTAIDSHNKFNADTIAYAFDDLHPFIKAVVGTTESGSIIDQYPTLAELESQFPNWLDPKNRIMQDFLLLKALEQILGTWVSRPELMPGLTAAVKYLRDERSE